MVSNQSNHTLPRDFSTSVGFDASRFSAGRDRSGLKERFLEDDCQLSFPSISDVIKTPQGGGASEPVENSSAAGRVEENSPEFNSNPFDELIDDFTNVPYGSDGFDSPNNGFMDLPAGSPEFGPYVPNNNAEEAASTSSAMSQVPGLTSDAPTPVDATDAKTPEPEEINSPSALRIHQGESDARIVARYDIDDALSKTKGTLSAHSNVTSLNALACGNHDAQIDCPAILEGQEFLPNAELQLIDLQDLESGEHHCQRTPKDCYDEGDDDEEDADQECDDQEDVDHSDTSSDAGAVATLGADGENGQEIFTPTSAEEIHNEDIEAALRRVTETADGEGIPNTADRKKNYKLVVDAALGAKTVKLESTIWVSVEQARREMESKVVRPKHDDTIPGTVAQKQALVEVLFTIITHVEFSTDNPRILQKFIKDWENKAKEIEWFCWEVVDLMIKRCTEGPLSSGTQFHGNFKQRMAAMVECLHYRKTSFLSALRPTFLQRLVDNPREKMNQSESNQRGNKKKGDDIKVGRQARAAERAASDTTASKTTSKSQKNGQAKKQRRNARTKKQATAQPRKDARTKKQEPTQSQKPNMNCPSNFQTLQPHPQVGKGGNGLRCIPKTPFSASHWATGLQKMQNGGSRQSSTVGIPSQRQTAHNPSFYMTSDTCLSSQPYQQMPAASSNSAFDPGLGTFTYPGSSSMDNNMHVVCQAQPEQHQQYHPYPAHWLYSTNNSDLPNLNQGTSPQQTPHYNGVPPYHNQNLPQPQEIHESSIMLEKASASNTDAFGPFNWPQSTATDFRQASFQHTDTRITRKRFHTDEGNDDAPVPMKRHRR
ncbi:hypothetical protein BDV10DRAFT_187479 [Aspergillus recurvatus]